MDGHFILAACLSAVLRLTAFQHIDSTPELKLFLCSPEAHGSNFLITNPVRNIIFPLCGFVYSPVTLNYKGERVEGARLTGREVQ